MDLSIIRNLCEKRNGGVMDRFTLLAEKERLIMVYEKMMEGK